MADSPSQQSSNEITQHSIIMEFFQNNQNRDVPHPEIVDWAVEEFKKRTGKIFRDPDRQIRSLHQKGFLIKVKKGVYRYEPNRVQKRELEDFSPVLRLAIFTRDDFRCVMCGRGPKEGVDLHVDHIKPKEFGGKATLENGQTLCGQHNMLKKTFRQTESGKKMFIQLYNIAKKEEDKKLIAFCTQILEVYEANDINGHIVWKR